MIEKPICISYPKSGRTWLRMILNSLEVDLDYSHIDTGADRKSWGKRFDELEVPCVKRDKIIFLHRDPRDVVVSMFYEITKRQLPKLDPAQHAKYEARGMLPPLSLGDFVRSPRFGIEKTIVFNIACRNNLNALILTYEKMMEDPVGSLNSLLNYLDISRSSEEINRSIQENDFKAMRAREETGDIPANMKDRLGPVDPSDANSYKVRRGIVGGWVDEMDAETKNYTAEIMNKYIYERYIR